MRRSTAPTCKISRMLLIGEEEIKEALKGASIREELEHLLVEKNNRLNT